MICFTRTLLLLLDFKKRFLKYLFSEEEVGRSVNDVAKSAYLVWGKGGTDPGPFCNVPAGDLSQPRRGYEKITG